MWEEVKQEDEEEGGGGGGGGEEEVDLVHMVLLIADLS